MDKESVGHLPSLPLIMCKLFLPLVIFLHKSRCKSPGHNVEIFVDGKISQILILSTERLRDPEREKVQFSAFKTSE